MARRRGNNEGSITKRKDGRWQALVSVGYDENGKLIRKSFYAKTRTEAVAKMNEYLVKNTNRVVSLQRNELLKDAMREWMLLYKRNMVTSSTFLEAFRNFELYIEKYIGNIKVSKATANIMQNHLNNLLIDGRSLNKVKKVKYLLNQFFDYAVDAKMISNNPILKTRIKSRENKRINEKNQYKAIPKDKRNLLLESLEKHEFLKALCMTSLYGGLRIGEVLGLKWENIDFENKKMKILFGAISRPKLDKDGKKIGVERFLSNTKTATSVRVIPIPDMLIDTLYMWKKSKNGNFDKSNDFIFSNREGGLRSYTGTRSILLRFLKKYNLDNLGITFHTLRHTYSNMLFEAKENPKVIQKLLGHKDVQTTIVTYNSVDSSYFTEATKKLEEQYELNKANKQSSVAKNKLELYDDLTLEDLEMLLEMKRKKKQNKADFDM